MKIVSTLLGELEFAEEDIIMFPAGIPAFEQEKSFLLIAMGEGVPFYYLQSALNPELCLVVANPFAFFPRYSIEIGQEELQRLDCSRREELLLYVILTVPQDFRQSTANLVAPLIINQESKKGLQFITTNSDYTTRHPIFQPAQAEERTGIAAAKEG
jgi:flagellar assembly factor FliW